MYCHLKSLLAALLLACLAMPASAGTLGDANDAGEFRYLVEFAEPGALYAVSRDPGEPFDADSAEAITYMETLRNQQADYLQAISDVLGRSPTVTHHYLVTHSGIAAWMTPVEANLVRDLAGVSSVERERIEQALTYRGPTFINADRIWDGSAVPDGVGTRGEGVIVGILDTGVDPAHPSFANVASCGHGDTQPNKLISYVDCTLSDSNGRCIGLVPEDTQSHGSHVASTAAGNVLVAGEVEPSPDPFDSISGVATCASIRSYKVCPDISCPGSAIQAGMNHLLLDGDVSVMNFSISGGNNPWRDNDRRKLDVVGSGVVVAASAGNTGPTDSNPVGEVNHLGPWVFTIAASTHDGKGSNVPTLSVSGPGTVPEALLGLPMIKGSAESGTIPDGEPFTGKPIRRYIDPAGEDAEGCVAFPPNYFAGAVALIKRGGCTFAQKTANAELAGAEFIIIRNNEPGSLASWNAGTPTVPAYSMSMEDGQAVADWIAQHPDTSVVDFDFVASDGEGGDVLAGFSLRGPTPAPLHNLTKPDITAPGVNIFAAEPTTLGFTDGYGFKSGTSMSGPHAAGAAALVRAVHPDWSAPEVKSAMMMTGFQGGFKSDGSTPWDTDDVGSGRVDLAVAARAGLVMHETHDNFLAANPATGGDVRTLNLPALRAMDCTPSCSWTRTVRNTLGTASTWTASGGNAQVALSVSPSSFSFSGDTSETQTLTITATPQSDFEGRAFTEVVLSESAAQSPDLHLSVVVSADAAAGPVVTTTVDNDDPAVEYERGWHLREDGGAIGSTHHRRMGNANGAEPPQVRLVFDGHTIRYFYGVSSKGGTADVYINGVHAGSVDYSGSSTTPEFGHTMTFDGLGDGTHEFLLVFRSGAAYVDGFEIDSGGDGGADASASGTEAGTDVYSGAISLAGTYVQSFDIPADATWLSINVEGEPQTATVLDVDGNVLAEGVELVDGAGTLGVDFAPAASTYVVEVTGAADAPVRVSVASERLR